MEAKLEELGLSRNESKIYLYLLKKGSTTTGSIIKNTQIANSRVYNSLNSLIKKGLVTYTVQKNGKHFQAEDPKKFLEIEEERKKKIQNMLPDMLNLKAIQEPETTSAVYEGFDGFKTAFKKIIDDCPDKGIIYILGFSEHTYKTRSLRTFIKNMNLKSEKRKQKLKVILDISTKGGLGKDREKEKFTEVRYMPEKYISPAAIDIMGDYVYIFLWEKKPYVFMIKNKAIAESFKQYFKFLWSISRP
ncbi:MAG: helix-turn-helix domain-containing protein [archaeon]